MLDIIIIGGGPAGLTAGLYSVRAGADTLLFEEALPGGKMQIIAKLENYPGMASVEGMSISDDMTRQAESAGLKIVNKSISALTVEQDHVTLTAGSEKYESKTAIIASGTVSKLLSVPGEREFTGMGVSYCATCDGPLYRGARVAVVGGGNTAFADALYLARFAGRVYIIHRRDEFRATDVLVKRARECENIEFITPAVVESINGKDLVESITYKRGDAKETVEVEGVFVAVGSLPNVSFVDEKILRTKEGFIITDEHMRTNIPFVFAAGDVRNTPLRQVVTAASDGAVAAEAAAAYI